GNPAPDRPPAYGGDPPHARLRWLGNPGGTAAQPGAICSMGAAVQSPRRHPATAPSPVSRQGRTASRLEPAVAPAGRTAPTPRRGAPAAAQPVFGALLV